MAAKEKAMGRSKATKQVGERSSNPAGAAENGEGTSARPKEPKHLRLTGKYLRFEPLPVRQQEVARVQWAIYANLPKITSALIELAVKGNTAAAKFLVDFAGVQHLPTMGKIQESGAEVSGHDSGDELNDDPSKAVLSFYQRLGVTPPRLKPPATVVAAAEETATAV